MEPNLSQALHLINGDTVNAKIQQGNLVGKMLAAGKTPDEVLNEIYLRCLARQPNEQERQLLAQELATAGEPKAALEDVFWAVLNSREFVFNH
jgi:hypothetical protein